MANESLRSLGRPWSDDRPLLPVRSVLHSRTGAVSRTPIGTRDTAASIESRGGLVRSTRSITAGNDTTPDGSSSHSQRWSTDAAVPPARGAQPRRAGDDSTRRFGSRPAVGRRSTSATRVPLVGARRRPRAPRRRVWWNAPRWSAVITSISATPLAHRLMMTTQGGPWLSLSSVG